MIKKDLFIPVILGTAREGRHTANAAQYVFEQVQKSGVATELVDVRDYDVAATIPAWVEDKRTQPWREMMTRADGLIIVAPEYNHGYPGELKLFLDQAYEQYARKPVAVCGTGGGLGGARMVEVLRITLIELQMVPTRNAVYFSGISELFDESGGIKDPSYDERVATLLEELLWYTQALKASRESS